MIVSIIVAIAENNIIGAGNELIWHLPEDLKSFKRLTLGHYIIMGRKTYESIGKPLPGRTNIIITRNPDFRATGCLVFNSLAAVLDYSATQNQHEVFIIGGAQIYSEAINNADKLYLTRIHASVPGDVYFPEIKWKDWTTVRSRHLKQDERHAYSFDIMELSRIRK